MAKENENVISNREGNSGGVHEESWIGGGKYAVHTMGL